LAFSGAVANADSGPGTAAYIALSRIAPALREENVRLACKSFGEYLVHAGYVTDENTDHWTRRNLGFAARQVDSILGNFCSGPRSLTPREDAIRAAESAFNTIGLESMPR
jgi:hypothetical protein